VRIILVLASGLIGGHILAAQAPSSRPASVVLAERCQICHETDLIASQRLSRDGWARELDKMVRWGAVLEPADREVLLPYLTAQYGPEPAAAGPGAETARRFRTARV
jgi:hypothetical protein